MRIIDFDIYKDLLQEKSGLVLEQDQSYLLDSRLMPIAKKWGYSSLDAMTAVLHGVPDKDLVDDVIEAMTTKETSFFRDFWPFYMVRDEILPALKAGKGSNKKLKIWCAAASTGQEAYTLGLIIKDKGNEFSGWKIEILVSDISADALEQAKHGIFSQFEIQRGLPIRTVLKHFKQVDDNNWQISSDIRKMMRYQTFNLLDNMSSLGKFDLILCRNVLSDFDNTTRRKTLDKLTAQLEPEGFLMVGRGRKEKIENENLRVMHEKRGVYVHKNSKHQTVQAAEPAADQTLAKGAV